jgi:hypothetical protein
METMFEQKLIEYRKRHLISVIRAVGCMFNEQPQFLDGYIVEQVNLWSNRLDEAIACFEDLKVNGYRKS